MKQGKDEQVGSRKKALRIFLILSGFFVLGVGVYSSFRLPSNQVWDFYVDSPEVKKNDKLQFSQASASKVERREESASLDSVDLENKSTSRMRSENERDFRTKYGEDSLFEYSKDGSLKSVHWKTTSRWSLNAIGSHEKRDVQSLIRESQSVLGDLLRTVIDSNIEVDSKKPGDVRTSPLSAQVTFDQTYQGYLVFPVRQVRLDYGKNGSLNRIESSLKPLENGNLEFSLPISRVRQNLESYTGIRLSEFESNRTNVQPIAWVSHGSTHPIAAYRVSSMGKEVILDASSGELIQKKNHRFH